MDRLEASNGGHIKIIGASISVNARSITLEGVKREHRSGLIANSGDEGTGSDITIKTDWLEVKRGARISTSAFGPGQVGNVTVTADRVFLSGDGALPTGIFAGRLFTKRDIELFRTTMMRAGDITVTAGNLEVRNGAEINASVEGSGQGGNVTINATDITLQDGGRISVEAESNIAGTPADAGNITLEVGDLLHLSNGSSITTSVAGGTGKGGTSPSIPFSSCSMRGAGSSPMLWKVKRATSSFICSVGVHYFSHPIAS